MGVFELFEEEAGCEAVERTLDCCCPGLGIFITATRWTSKVLLKEYDNIKGDDDEDDDD